MANGDPAKQLAQNQRKKHKPPHVNSMNYIVMVKMKQNSQVSPETR
jgi:hypothetical protein